MIKALLGVHLWLIASCLGVSYAAIYEANGNDNNSLFLAIDYQRYSEDHELLSSDNLSADLEKVLSAYFRGLNTSDSSGNKKYRSVGITSVIHSGNYSVVGINALTKLKHLNMTFFVDCNKAPCQVLRYDQLPASDMDTLVQLAELQGILDNTDLLRKTSLDKGDLDNAKEIDTSVKFVSGNLGAPNHEHFTVWLDFESGELPKLIKLGIPHKNKAIDAFRRTVLELQKAHLERKNLGDSMNRIFNASYAKDLLFIKNIRTDNSLKIEYVSPEEYAAQFSKLDFVELLRVLSVGKREFFFYRADDDKVVQLLSFERSSSGDLKLTAEANSDSLNGLLNHPKIIESFQ